jgi:hypothetical protein
VLERFVVENHREVEYEINKNQLEMNIVRLKVETLSLNLSFLWDYQYVDHVDDRVRQLNEGMDFYRVQFIFIWISTEIK